MNICDYRKCAGCMCKGDPKWMLHVGEKYYCSNPCYKADLRNEEAISEAEKNPQRTSGI